MRFRVRQFVVAFVLSVFHRSCCGQSITNTSVASVDGNCVTTKYNFDVAHGNRIAQLKYPSQGVPTTPPAEINANYVDFMLDFGKDNFVQFDDHVELTLRPTSRGPGYSSGARLTSTRYSRYGKFTLRMSAPPADHGGWVTAFITMSGSKDEIDWELVGKRSDQALTNVFYRGIPEFNMHDTVENMPFNSSVHLVHDYTIDWKPSGIIWSIDGTPVRTYLKGDSWENTTMCPGCWWFPDTPSVVSMSIWDGSLISGEWAGKNVTFGGGDGLSMRVYSLDVQCYNASGYPVDAQPPLQLQQRPQPQSPDSSASVVANSLADNFRAMIGVVVAIVVIVCSM